MIDSREELIISPTGEGNPTLRQAYFIKPSITSFGESISQLSSFSFSSLPSKYDPQNWPFSVSFSGWRFPTVKWKAWVEKMAPFHENTWKKAGIYEAIMSSTYKIVKNPRLVLGIAERWCPETKSFMFSWGEATITLEDVMVLSGYSALGSPVFEPLESEELVEGELIKARQEILKSRARKALQNLWMEKFKDSGSKIEHEAFLAYWLSRFVFPSSFNIVNDCIFPIAVHLARGTRLALAPAVLASIYLDLGLLKEKIAALSTLEIGGVNKDHDDVLAIAILSPFQLVQLWVWERFPALQPKPKLIKNGEPRFAQWDGLKCRTHNVRLVLDSAKETFNWRPYTKPLQNWNLPSFYREKEMWVAVDSGLDEELLSFVQCFKVSELVGLGCIEQYLPHRVSMQFGLDQDIPGYAARSNESLETAWHCYSRPVAGLKYYIPSRYFEADVTTRYLEWWRGFMSFLQGAGDLQQKNSSTNLSITLKSLKAKKKNEKHKGCNFVSSFKIAPRNPRRKKAAMKFMNHKASSNSGQGTKKGGTVSRFKIKPKLLKRATNAKHFRSIFTIMQNTLKEKTEDDGSASARNSWKTSSQSQPTKKSNGYCFVASSVPVEDLSATPDLSLKSFKKSAGSLKRKRREKDAMLSHKGASIANVSPARKPDQRLKYGSEDYEVASPNYPVSLAVIKEINSSQVPPGFPRKVNRAEAIDSIKEDQLTIAELLRTMDKHGGDKRQCHDGKNFLVQNQNNKSSIANIGIAKTSRKVISMKKIVQDASMEKIEEHAAIENQLGGEGKKASDQCGNHSSSIVDNEAIKASDPAIILKKEDGHGKLAWNRQTCNSKDTLGPSSHSHSPLSLFGGNNASGNLESLAMSKEKILEKIVLSETSTGMKEEGVEYANESQAGNPACKVTSINVNEGGSVSYAVEEPWLKLEARLERLEKIAALLKAR